MTTALKAIEQPTDVNDSASLMRIIDRAAQSGDFDVAKLESLLAVKERWEAGEARKAFVVALNQFKADPPVLTKNKLVSFQTSKGKTEYKHATLDQVSGIIGAALARVGISHRWEIEQLDGGKIRVTCVLTHSQGHSERVPLQGSPDDSGGKNSIQGIGSTVTYLQRYTLLAATGMAVADGSDDDARGTTGAHQLDPRAREEFAALIAAASDRKHLESLWQTIAAACSKAGDTEAYEGLKALVSTKAKAIAAPKESAPRQMAESATTGTGTPSGSQTSASAADPPDDALLIKAREFAECGTEKYAAFWTGLTAEQRKQIGAARHESFKEVAGRSA